MSDFQHLPKIVSDDQMISCPENSHQLARLRAIMHRLRAPGGCPWDAEQTHESIVPNLIEETYETVDTIQRGDHEHLKEELGDLLLQVVFHSEIAEEAGRYNLDDVARGISDKLVHRHPHVFAQSDATSTDEVLQQWDDIKRVEKGNQDKPYLHGIGKELPALLRAAKLQKKAAKVGFDWPDEAGVMDKLDEEAGELKSAIADGDPKAIEEELGDLLFSAVNLARTRKLDPEVIMANANNKFEQRFAVMEESLKSQGLTLDEASLEQMEAAWQAAKEQPRIQQ